MATKVLDAVVIGGGPSGLGASLALSGWRPYYVARCALEDYSMERHFRTAPRDVPIGAGVVRELAGSLHGRSNNPLALFFDALQHPGVDRGMAEPSCLELRHKRSDDALSHVVLDSAPPGGSWHGMHEATRTLSPGPWMELPGFPLADYLSATPRADEASSAVAARRQPRRLIAQYYEEAARFYGIAGQWRRTRASAVRRARDGEETDQAHAHEHMHTCTHAHMHTGTCTHAHTHARTRTYTGRCVGGGDG